MECWIDGEICPAHLEEASHGLLNIRVDFCKPCFRQSANLARVQGILEDFWEEDCWARARNNWSDWNEQWDSQIKSSFIIDRIRSVKEGLSRFESKGGDIPEEVVDELDEIYSLMRS